MSSFFHICFCLIKNTVSKQRVKTTVSSSNACDLILRRVPLKIRHCSTFNYFTAMVTFDFAFFIFDLYLECAPKNQCLCEWHHKMLNDVEISK